MSHNLLRCVVVASTCWLSFAAIGDEAIARTPQPIPLQSTAEERRVERRIDRVRGEIRSLERQLARANKDAAEASGELAELEAIESRLNAQIRAAQQKVDRAQATFARIDREYGPVMLAVQEQTQKRDELAANLTAFERQARQAHAQTPEMVEAQRQIDQARAHERQVHEAVLTETEAGDAYIAIRKQFEAAKQRLKEQRYASLGATEQRLADAQAMIDLDGKLNRMRLQALEDSTQLSSAKAVRAAAEEALAEKWKAFEAELRKQPEHVTRKVALDVASDDLAKTQQVAGPLKQRHEQAYLEAKAAGKKLTDLEAKADKLPEHLKQAQVARAEAEREAESARRKLDDRRRELDRLEDRRDDLQRDRE